MTSSDHQPRLPSSSINQNNARFQQRNNKNNKYKNEFHDSQGIESQSVEELESYAMYKSEENTKTVNNCVRIAEEIRGSATQTLITLHQQGEQITRTHMAVTDTDRDLSRGEKILGSLGGIFSRKWKPKTRKLTGPVMITRGDDFLKRKTKHMEQKERLGLASTPNAQPKSRAQHPEPTNALQKVEYEKAKQDEALTDLSNVLGELKEMAMSMELEFDRQKDALRPIDKDVNKQVNGVDDANRRGKWMLDK